MTDQEARESACPHANQHHLMEACSCGYRIADRTRRQIDPMTDQEARDALIEQATWALIEWDTDTADRGVSDEHYRDRRADVERVFDIIAGYRKHPEPEITDASPGCPACGHAIAEHHGRWCRVPTGAVSRRGSALICCCEAVDAAEGER